MVLEYYHVWLRMISTPDLSDFSMVGICFMRTSKGGNQKNSFFSSWTQTENSSLASSMPLDSRYVYIYYFVTSLHKLEPEPVSRIKISSTVVLLEQPHGFHIVIISYLKLSSIQGRAHITDSRFMVEKCLSYFRV